MSFIGRAYDRWQIINKINGDFIARVAISLFYYTVCALFAGGALLINRFRPGIDPLNRKHPATWTDRLPIKAAIEDARRQF